MTDQPPEARPRTPVIIWSIVAAIAASYGAWMLASPAQQQWADYTFAIIPARFDPASPYHFTHWYEALGPLFGHSLLHVAWWHAALNGFFFFAAGRVPALRIGALRFLVVYLVSALGAAAAFILLNWGSEQLAVGASGAVCGVFSAYFLSARRTWREALADPGVRGPFFMIFFLNVVVMAVLAQTNVFPIAWEGHLGGFIAGALSYAALAPRARGPWR